MLVLASPALTIVVTFGVALIAAAAGGTAIFATLDDEDRAAAGRLLRHPLRTIFSDAPPERDED